MIDFRASTELRRARAAVAGNELWNAFHSVAEALGASPSSRPPAADLDNDGATLRTLAAAEGLRLRRVRLRGDKWWKQDLGPLVAFVAESGRAAALLPGPGGMRLCLRPSSEPPQTLTEQAAAEIDSEAYMLYRGLPDARLSLPQLIQFGLRGSSPEWLTFLVAGVAAAVLAWCLPLGAYWTIERGTVGVEDGSAAMILFAFLAGTLGTALVDLTCELTTLRLQGRLELSLHAALWDRMLRLPAVYYRAVPAAAAAEQAASAGQIPPVVAGVWPRAWLGATTLAASGLLLFTFEPALAWVAVGALVCVFAASVAMAGRTLSDQFELDGHRIANGDLLCSLLASLPQLRLANRTLAVVEVWKRRSRLERRLSRRLRVWEHAEQSLGEILPALATLGLVAAIAAGMTDTADFHGPAFVGFLVALVQCLGAMNRLATAVGSCRAVRYGGRRLRPILQHLPESKGRPVHADSFRGEVRVAGLTFCYPQASTPALHQVSLRIRPGQLVGIVGRSGSGKSTLLRLLLGIDTPDRGHIYFDGVDLSQLDVESLRNQCGTVLQNQALGYGTIHNLLVGMAPFSLEDVRQATRLAAIDREIAALPMGMQTFVGDELVSVGQKQRLLIAKALLHRPRFLLLDEATTAIDEAIEFKIFEQIKRLKITTVVVSHRPSTMAQMDQLVGLERGRLVSEQPFHGRPCAEVSMGPAEIAALPPNKS